MARAPATLEIPDHFPEPRARQPGTVIYPLPQMLLPILAGTLPGAEENSVEIEECDNEHPDFLRMVLPNADSMLRQNALNEPEQCYSPCSAMFSGRAPRRLTSTRTRT